MVGPPLAASPPPQVAGSGTVEDVPNPQVHLVLLLWKREQERQSCALFGPNDNLFLLFYTPRLLYWLAYAMGRSFRAFGYGLTFLPLIAMLLFNFYSMFIMDPETMFAIADSSVDAPLEKGKQLAASKPRYWG